MKTASALAFLIALTASCFAGTPDISSKTPVTVEPPVESNAGFFADFELSAFHLNSFSLGDPLKVDLKFKDGWGSSLGLGYDFGNGFSAMVSGGYYRGYYDQLTLHEAGISQDANTWGNVSFSPFLVGGAYTFKIVGNLSWYIGGGAGPVHEAASWPPYDRPRGERTLHFNKFHNAPAHLDGFTDESWEFGFQAFTGLGYQWNPRTMIKLGYSYMYVDSRMAVNGDSGPALQAQTIQLGVVWKF